jgi:hypothetical protein
MKKFEVIFTATERTLYRATIEAETPETALLLFDDTASQVDWDDVKIIDREIDQENVRTERYTESEPGEFITSNTKRVQLPWPKWLKDKYMVQLSVDAVIDLPNTVNYKEVDGKLYLAWPDGEIFQYTRGVAIKKARMFGGKIVKN